MGVGLGEMGRGRDGSRERGRAGSRAGRGEGMGERGKGWE